MGLISHASLRPRGHSEKSRSKITDTATSASCFDSGPSSTKNADSGREILDRAAGVIYPVHRHATQRSAPIPGIEYLDKMLHSDRTPSLSAGRGRLTCAGRDNWALDVSYYEERVDDMRQKLRDPIGHIVLLEIAENEAEQIRAFVPCVFLLHDGDRQMRCTLKRIRWAGGHPYRVDLDVLSRHPRMQHPEHTGRAIVNGRSDRRSSNDS